MSGESGYFIVNGGRHFKEPPDYIVVRECGYESHFRETGERLCQSTDTASNETRKRRLNDQA